MHHIHQSFLLAGATVLLVTPSSAKAPAEEPQRTIPAHSGVVRSVAFTPDGETLVSCGGAAVKVWDVATGREKRKLQITTGAVDPKGLDLESPYYGLALSSDGKMLAASKGDGTVHLWELATGEPKGVLLGRKSGTLVVAYAPDGKTVAAANNDGVVKLWDLTTLKERASFKHGSGAWSVAFDPAGKVLATGGNGFGADIKLWDPATGAELATLRGHGHGIIALAFSPDGKLLASGCYDKTVKLWDMTTRKESATLREHKGFVNGVAFSPDGQTLATSGDDGTLKLWDVATRTERASFQAHAEVIWSLAFAPDGKTLATGGTDAADRQRTPFTIKLWNVAKVLEPKAEK